ncbi:MAG: hypothetical protein HDT33_02850 [Clostridiales bacterium]|nr:hypothetical protein [Clostridiales bacterium]
MNYMMCSQTSGTVCRSKNGVLPIKETADRNAYLSAVSYSVDVVRSGKYTAAEWVRLQDNFKEDFYYILTTGKKNIMMLLEVER